MRKRDLTYSCIHGVVMHFECPQGDLQLAITYGYHLAIISNKLKLFEQLQFIHTTAKMTALFFSNMTSVDHMQES